MSAYEIGTFLLPLMPSIIPYLPTMGGIRAEFEAMCVMLATHPQRVLDEILPWIQPRIGQEDDDVIELHLCATQLHTTAPVISVPGCAR